ncbi:MAG: ferrous iron transport protein B [Anaerolineae bacterium]|nr:ferrous iron transport protein B [Anaerolineae bacterium]
MARPMTADRPTRSLAGTLSCCDQQLRSMNLPSGTDVVTVALAGQPNVGKTTVFNLLTGLNQHVGNWPGKTVEQKIGVCHSGNVPLALVDLPGTYSLTAGSEEERVARDFILHERPDVVVLVADASNLERNLYLLSELLLLPVPIVLALNMVDVAEEYGIHTDAEALSQALGIPVVPMVASRNRGVRELLQVVQALACDGDRNTGAYPYHPRRPQLRPDHRDTLAALLRLIQGRVPEPYPEEWVAIKLLEGDREVTELAQGWLPQGTWQEVHSILHRHEDAILDIAGGRYQWIGEVLAGAQIRRGLGQVGLTERLDRWATHPLWGMAILGAAAALMFFLVYTVGSPLQGVLEEYVVTRPSAWLSTHLDWAPAWVTGLLTDGVLAGAGTMATFVPILAIFFAALGFFEDTGYMARAAFVMDRFMHAIGLHGRSFLPLFLGFGCNVPAIMGARIADSPRARLLGILLAPLVPCTARLGVLTTLAAAFFGPYAFVVTLGLVGTNLVVLALLGVVLHRLVLRGEQAAFIMELPLYHRPNGRSIALFVWHHLRAFLARAVTIIMAASVVVWALSALPAGDIGSSYLAAMGQALEPLGRLMGLGWRLMVALLASFVAKENSLAVMGVLFAGAETGAGLTEVLPTLISPASALAFLTVQMLFIPCVATMAAIRKETGSWAWALFDLCLLLVISFLGGAVAYQVGLLLGWGA